jgi:hypothetical protein
LLDEATPAGLVQVEQNPAGPALAIIPLDAMETLSALMRQVVIPADATHAGPLINCVAATAAHLRGARVLVGLHAFASPGFAEKLEQTLRRLVE